MHENIARVAAVCLQVHEYKVAGIQLRFLCSAHSCLNQWECFCLWRSSAWDGKLPSPPNVLCILERRVNEDKAFLCSSALIQCSAFYSSKCLHEELSLQCAVVYSVCFLKVLCRMLFMALTSNQCSCGDSTHTFRVSWHLFTAVEGMHTE